MADDRQTTEMRFARNFLIALRSHGVKDHVARFITRNAVEQYASNVGRRQIKRARFLLSAERAKFLADELKKGFHIP